MVVSYANRAGTERHIATLGGELAGRGWQVAVLSPPGPATEWWQEAGLYVLNYDPQAAGIRRMIGSLRRQTEHWLANDVDTPGPTVIHVHGSPESLFFLRVFRRAADSSRASSRPVFVFTVHGFCSHLPAWDYWFAARVCRHWADLVICVSHVEAARLARYWHELTGGPLATRRGHVVHNGTTMPTGLPERYAGPNQERATARPGPETWTVGFAGRLVRQKGPEYLLKAVALMAKQLATGNGAVRRVHLLVAGEGEERPKLEALARELQAESPDPAWRVEFLGSVPDMAALWDRLDVLALPSLSEALPLVVIEAMARGLPVVASRIPGLDEVVVDGETGLLVPPGDVDALARALLRLAQDPTFARRLGAEGARRARSLFSAERMATETEKLYWQAWHKVSPRNNPS